MADRKKILTIIGSRTQAIKAAVVSRALKSHAAVAQTRVFTGGALSENFYSRLQIEPPHINLGLDLFSPNQPVDPLLEAIEKTIGEESPDIVLVFSDSNATLAGALAASRTMTPLARVEAGVRSFTRQLAKERIRILCDHASDILFTVNEDSAANLRKEDIAEDKIHTVGDIMFDSGLHYAERVPDNVPVFEQTGIVPGQYVLATIHRPENTDSPQKLEQIIRGLIAASMACPVLMPLHPRTRMAMQNQGLMDLPMNKLHIIDPVSYLEIICLEKKARMIVTDSSGMQKEAYFHGKPCITVRDKTEWTELVRAGWNRLVAADSYTISRAVGQTLGAPLPYGERTLFGKGNAGQMIAGILAAV